MEQNSSNVKDGGNSLIKFAIQLHPELRDENKSPDKVFHCLIIGYLNRISQSIMFFFFLVVGFS